MWSTWSSEAFDRGGLRTIAKGCCEHADDAAVCRERAQLVVPTGCAVWSMRARQFAWLATQTAPAPVSRHVGEGPLGGVREVEDLLPAWRSRPSSSAEAGETAVGGLAEAVRERVATIPGERHHAHAELPEDVRDPWVVAQRLDAFEREHEPDSVAALDRVEIRAASAPPATRSGFSRTAWWSAVTWRSASRRRSLRLELELDEDRADLQADAAGLEQRQPRLREDVRLAEPVLAVRELQQQVGVGVGEQPADYPLSDDRRRVHARRSPCSDPATGEEIAGVPRLGAAETRRAIEAAARALPAWRARTAKERAQILRGFADLMLERQQDLARLITRRAGQAAGRVARRDRLRGLVPRVVRRGGEARLRRHDPGATGRPGSSSRRSRSASPAGSRPGTSPPR